MAENSEKTNEIHKNRRKIIESSQLREIHRVEYNNREDRTFDVLDERAKKIHVIFILQKKIYCRKRKISSKFISYISVILFLLMSWFHQKK